MSTEPQKLTRKKLNLVMAYLVASDEGFKHGILIALRALGVRDPEVAAKEHLEAEGVL